MIKNYLRISILCALTIFVSCSEEELDTQELDVATQELATDLSQYENTSLGQYKGVFSTLDSEQRGLVDIQVISEELARATINVRNGATLFFESTPSRNAAGELVVQFDANGTSFEFSVGADGSDPKTASVTLSDIQSDIVVVKENTRDAIVTSTGTFTGTGPSGGLPEGTWNIIFDSTAEAGMDTTAFTTQVLFGGVDIGSSMGNTQTNCSDDGMVQTCDVSGTAALNANVTIDWMGTHTSQLAMECSSFAGTWSGPGGSAGTFTADELCFECENAAAVVGGVASAEDGDNAIVDLQTRTFTATSAETGTIGTDAGIENVVLNITHTWNSDMSITLISPAGTTLDLSSANGGSADNYTGTVFTDTAATNITAGAAPFTGEFQPEGGFLNDVFAGESVTGDWTLTIADAFNGDPGTLDSWTIAFCDGPVGGAPPPPPPPAGCNGTSTPVAGASGGMITDAMPLDAIATVTQTGTIGVDADITNLSLNITHTWSGDMELTLISPAGTSLVLADNLGGSDDDVYTGTVFIDGGADIQNASTPYTGEFEPEGGTFAAAFDGESITGDWTLNVTDTAAGDDGVLVDWTIEFCDENIPFAPNNNNGNNAKIARPFANLSKAEYKALLDLKAGNK